MLEGSRDSTVSNVLVFPVNDSPNKGRAKVLQDNLVGDAISCAFAAATENPRNVQGGMLQSELLPGGAV
jgi:hypothetical protein